ncbi:MAG: NADH-quinone oxidoreductase subunit J [Calditrichaeota bacterium]|nr:NADH-quinone oxidoreductase subunit J [Calditrichota bacterium]
MEATPSLFVQILFAVCALVTVISAAVVVFSGRILHSAFALFFTFCGVAALYVFLFADFLAVTQVLIYVGGILILIIFGLLLTQRIMDLRFTDQSHQRIRSVLLAVVFAAVLIGVMAGTPWRIAYQPDTPTVEILGVSMLTQFLVPFEMASMLLLVALIGAVWLARVKRKFDE